MALLGASGGIDETAILLTYTPLPAKKGAGLSEGTTELHPDMAQTDKVPIKNCRIELRKSQPISLSPSIHPTILRPLSAPPKIEWLTNTRVRIVPSRGVSNEPPHALTGSFKLTVFPVRILDAVRQVNAPSADTLS